MTERSAIAYLGVGSNLQPEGNIPLALDLLQDTPGIQLSGISTFFRTAPIANPQRMTSVPSVAGTEADPDFLNGVLEIRTLLTSQELLKRLAQIEARLGRKRPADRWGPRTMDLDLLLYGLYQGPGTNPLWEEIGEEGVLAHPDIHKRGFVALPLLELAPDLVLPPHRVPLRALALSFDSPGGTIEELFTENLRVRFLPG